jgi:hypothetical protein
MSNRVINLLPMGAITCGVIFWYCAEAQAQSSRSTQASSEIPIHYHVIYPSKPCN